MNLKNGKVFTSKFVGTEPSSSEKRIYRAAVSQILRNTDTVYKLQYQVDECVYKYTEQFSNLRIKVAVMCKLCVLLTASCLTNDRSLNDSIWFKFLLTFKSE